MPTSLQQYIITLYFSAPAFKPRIQIWSKLSALHHLRTCGLRLCVLLTVEGGKHQIWAECLQGWGLSHVLSNRVREKRREMSVNGSRLTSPPACNLIIWYSRVEYALFPPYSILCYLSNNVHNDKKKIRKYIMSDKVHTEGAFHWEKKINIYIWA